MSSNQFENTFVESTIKNDSSLEEIESSDTELLENYDILQNKYDKLVKELVELKKKDNLTANRKDVYKFEVNNVFYILSFDRTKASYKFGITGDINKRLQTYRTSNPQTHIKYLVYTDKNQDIENMFKTLSKIKSSLVFNSSEIVCGDLKNIIKCITNIIDMLDDTPHRICSQTELNMYNSIIENDDIILYGNKLKQPEIQLPNWDKPFKIKDEPYLEYDDNNNVTRKKCTKCNLVKIPEHFHKKIGKPGNLSSQCILCRNSGIDYVEIEEKMCIKCNVTKSIDKFYQSRTSVDKYENSCKDCRFLKPELIKNTIKNEPIDNTDYTSIYEEHIQIELRKTKSKIYIKYDENNNIICKSCSQCKLIKPSDKFYSKIGVIGNLSCMCIACKLKDTSKISEKKCTKCEKTKNVTDYYTSKLSKDGYENICKECRFPEKEVIKDEPVIENQPFQEFVRRTKPQLVYDDNNNLIQKSCSKCKQLKPVSNFQKQTGRLGGLRSQCTPCRQASR